MMELVIPASQRLSNAIRAATLRLEKNPRDVLALLARAEAYMEQHDAKSARQDIELSLHIALVEPRLTGAPRSALLAQLYTLQSRACAGLGDWDAATQAINQALEQKADDVNALTQRGRIYRESGNLPNALTDFDRALALDAHSAITYVGRGLTRHEMDDYQGALNDYNQALTLDHTLAIAWSNRGNTHFALGNYPQAESDCRRALQGDPYLTHAYEIAAYICRQRGDLEEALALTTTGLQYQPRDNSLLIQAAHTYIDWARLPEALVALDTVLQQTPAHSEACSLRGQVYGRLGNYVAAIDNLNRAVQLNPIDIDTLFNLALAYTHTGDLNAALSVLERVLALAPNDAEAQAFYQRLVQRIQPPSKAELYLTQGDFENALKEWELEIAAAHKTGNSNEECHLLILAGAHYVKIRQTKKGTDYIQKGMKLAQKIRAHEEVAQAHIELAYIDMAQKKPKQAAKHFQQVLKIGQQVGNKHYEHLGLGNLGAVYAQMGHLEEACKLIQQACHIAGEMSDKHNQAAYYRNLGRLCLQLVIPDNPFHARYAHRALVAFEQVQQLRQELGLEADPELTETIERIQTLPR